MGVAGPRADGALVQGAWAVRERDVMQIGHGGHKGMEQAQGPAWGWARSGWWRLEEQWEAGKGVAVASERLHVKHASARGRSSTCEQSRGGGGETARF